LRFDRTQKAEIYAGNKIPDYWIVNLPGRCPEIYRKPMRDKNLGFVYREIQVLSEKDMASPLSAPKAKIAVGDLLP
jgi:Uma2 family endonuclease